MRLISMYSKLSKYLLCFFLVSLSFLQTISVSKIQAEQHSIEEYKNNRVIVKFKENAEKTLSIASFAEGYTFEDKNISVFEFDSAASLDLAITQFKKSDSVEYVQPDFQYETSSINTDDEYKLELWGLDNTGQTVAGDPGTADADIDLSEAWEIYSGYASEIIVGVIDTGVDYVHEDLAASMWDGSNCKDFEGNQLGGCMGGYDFEEDDKNPFPSITNNVRNHGTHVSGVIAAQRNNAKGVLGVAPNAKIMALKSALTTSEILRALDFAEKNNARIINASWGGSIYDQALFNAIEDYPGLVIAASHNKASNNDAAPIYPCNYALDNIICVGATDQNDALAEFSNYGVNSVDIAAPGVNILSTIAFGAPESPKYEYFQGTSMATPYVTGAAALLLGYQKDLSNSEIKNSLLATADHIPSLDGKIAGGRRLNLFNLLKKYRDSSPLYRFWSVQKQGHFYTADTAERDNLIATDSTWQYEGVAYYVGKFNPSNASCEGNASPVFRFFNPKKMHHFYTVSLSERDSLINSDPNWVYEGIGFCTELDPNSNNIPVFRFFSESRVAHFYTINVSERDSLIANDPTWQYEGVSYYAFN